MASNFNLNALRSYAQKTPESLPSSVLFSHTSRTITIYDAYPKSIFHFLVLPRLTDGLRLEHLKDLKTLMNLEELGGKTRAKEVLVALKEDGYAVKQAIGEEMMRKYGFKWDVWVGFHGAPSMQHLHLHVISADLVSEKMKHKKHYNSFHPKLGFFLDIEEVLSWFEADPSFYTTKAKGMPLTYERLLKEDLSCFHCKREKKNFPILKAHLEEEWNKLKRVDLKRKNEDETRSKRVQDDRGQ